METRSRPGFFSSDLGILSLLALALFVLHLLTNGAYGFHRDELLLLDNARHLDWGYVAYPPLAPFIARLSLALLGPTLVGFRVFSAVAMSAAMVLTGLMARDLGGGRFAQVVSAIAAAIAPIALIQGAVFQYVSMDYFWWVLIAFFTLRLLKSEDPRWWLGIGAAIGLGMMTKYTIVFFIAGLVLAVLIEARNWLRSPWLWAGAALSLLIYLPNLLWQIQHDFISLEFLSAIHARDVEIGRTQGYLLEQLFVSTNPATFLIWLSGLNYYFRNPAGRRFGVLGWMFVIPFFLLLLAQGRSYYLAPAYPMLFAAGAVQMEKGYSRRGEREERTQHRQAGYTLAFGFVMGAVLMLPIAPVGSGWFNLVSQVHDNFAEQVGWPEITETVAGIYARLPPAERERTAILTGNYGEAGAINLYGPNHGLPEVLSPVNSYWLRGYGDPPPETLIVLGYSAEQAGRLFEECELAGQTVIPHGIENEESESFPDIFLCRGPRQPWPALWQEMRRFG